MSETRYLLVETQSPADGPGAGEFVDSAFDLAHAGRKVSLWLLQNGVLTLFGQDEGLRTRIAEANNLMLYVDSFSLAQRSVEPGLVEATGGRLGAMSELVAQLMAPHCRVIWH